MSRSVAPMWVVPLIIAFVIADMAPFGARAQAPGQKWTQSGMLRCKLNPSIGFIIFGHQTMECRFVPSLPGPQQIYDGALNTVGIDVGIIRIGDGGEQCGCRHDLAGLTIAALDHLQIKPRFLHPCAGRSRTNRLYGGNRATGYRTDRQQA